MRKICCLICSILVLAASGCNSHKVSDPQVTTAPPSGVIAPEPSKPLSQLPSKNPGHNYPEPWGNLSEHAGSMLTVRNSKNATVASLSPSDNAVIPLDKDGYEIELLLHKDHKASGDPKVESSAWHFLANSGASWVTDGGVTVFRFHVSLNDDLKVEMPADTLQVPVSITLQGVAYDSLRFSVGFDLIPKDMTPISKYGLTLEGKVIDDSRLIPLRSELANKNLQLVTFTTPNDFAADVHVALCDTDKNQALFVADLSTFSGFSFWTGWVNDQEFFIGNNYELAIFNINGQKRQIFRRSDNDPPHRNAIHGLAWSRATQTMGMVYCDGQTEAMDLKLFTDNFNSTKNVAVVDKQDWYRGGSERFPMQVSIMTWDDTGERLAFTKTKDYSLAIYNRKTGVIEDVGGVSKVVSIKYDPLTNQFLTTDKYE